LKAEQAWTCRRSPMGGKGAKDIDILDRFEVL